MTLVAICLGVKPTKGEVGQLVRLERDLPREPSPANGSMAALAVSTELRLMDDPVAIGAARPLARWCSQARVVTFVACSVPVPALERLPRMVSSQQRELAPPYVHMAALTGCVISTFVRAPSMTGRAVVELDPSIPWRCSVTLCTSHGEVLSLQSKIRQVMVELFDLYLVPSCRGVTVLTALPIATLVIILMTGATIRPLPDIGRSTFTVFPLMTPTAADTLVLSRQRPASEPVIEAVPLTTGPSDEPSTSAAVLDMTARTVPTTIVPPM